MQLDSNAVLNLIPGLYIAIGGIVFALGLGLSAICLLRNPSPNPGQGKGSSGSGVESALDADARRYAARLGLVGAIMGAIIMAAGPVLASLIQTFGPAILPPKPVAVATISPSPEHKPEEVSDDSDVPLRLPEITPARAGSPTPTLFESTPVPGSSDRCIDRAAFISDVTIPDSTYVEGGMPFTKTWRLRNMGTCVWAGTYALVFDHGHAMGGPSIIPLAGTVAPGQTVDVAVNLTAPASPGTYQGFWKLRNTNETSSEESVSGDLIFWVTIVVPGVGEPTPTDNPSPFVSATGTPAVTPDPSMTSPDTPMPTATPTESSMPTSVGPATATPSGFPSATPSTVSPPTIGPTLTFTLTPTPTSIPTPTSGVTAPCDEGLCGGSLTVQAFRDFRCVDGGFQAGVDQAIGGALVTLAYSGGSRVVRKVTNANGLAYFESVDLPKGITATLSVEWPAVAEGRLVACPSSREVVVLTAEDFLSMGSHFVSFRARMMR